MASMFKQLLNEDKAITRTPLYETVPLTGSLWDGTDYPAYDNIKLYSHGMFASVYDYPYASSSANHLLDITFGLAADSEYYVEGEEDMTSKVNIYNQMCQVLMGYDEDGLVKPLVNPITGEEMKEVFIINLSRLVYKDEVKKGSVGIDFVAEAAFDDIDCAAGAKTTLAETGSYLIDSPVSEYAALTGSAGGEGVVFYQAGVLVLSGSAFEGLEANGDNDTFGYLYTSGSIEDLIDAILPRVCALSVVSTTELNSTIYFLRLNHNEFNYSSNPTYLSDSQIVVRDTIADPPVSYITGAGLYSAQGELLAVAKLSEPLKKDPSTELTLRMRVDY